MKRIIKIILILIAVFFLILGIIWLIGRNKATKNGGQPLTFREFLGLSTKKNPTQTVPDAGSSDFTGNGAGTNGDGTNGNGTNGIGTSGSNYGGFNVNSSTFTSGSYNPFTSGSNTGSNGSGSTSGNGSGSSSGSNGSEGDGGSPGDSNDGSQPACSDEDTNIPFTQDQLDQLNILQNRFYTLAQTLHNDADVETELANHDSFENKANSIFEEYAYCESSLPAIYSDSNTDPRLKLHIATPFWRSWHDSTTTDMDPDVAARIRRTIVGSTITRDPAQDSLSFLTFSGNGLAHTTGVHDNNDDNPEKPLPRNGIDQLLPGVSLIRGPYGLVTFSNPESVPTTGSSLGDFDIITPVTEKFLRINLW